MAESKIVVYGAIAANVAIAVTKFVVAGMTGSSAMLSEGIHSAVDSGNGVLLLIGMHLSRRPATADHPFGHGKELYFWSLIVAVLIFGLGGGVSFYEGLLHWREPAAVEDATWNYVVLAAAALFEGTSFGIALREFLRQSGDRPFWSALVGSKDPSTFTVLVEDAAALTGLAIAAAGVYASHALGMPRLDGAASMLIGALLASVAVLLIRESRSLLIGEGIRPETARHVREIALARAAVEEVGTPRSMYVGRDAVLLTMEVQFRRATPVEDVVKAIAQIEHEVRARFPVIRHIYVEASNRGP
ncbi:MAG: cation diffusion facilitator family transporter [Rubrivivax sp.]|nr:cation diffusion facilitator family transporter [Rubrivivax sp.]